MSVIARKINSTLIAGTQFSSFSKYIFIVNTIIAF